MSAMLKGLCRIFGIALIVFGVIWALQGAGIITWPASSPMIADRNWAVYGGIAAIIGFVITMIAGRIGK